MSDSSAELPVSAAVPLKFSSQASAISQFQGPVVSSPVIGEDKPGPDQAVPAGRRVDDLDLPETPIFGPATAYDESFSPACLDNDDELPLFSVEPSHSRSSSAFTAAGQTRHVGDSGSGLIWVPGAYHGTKV